MVNKKAIVPQEPEKDTIRSWKQALPIEGVVDLFGHRRQGKSGTAWWLAEELHDKDNYNVASFLFPKKGKKLVPSWVKHIYSIEQLKKLRGHLVIADEMALHANARDHQSDPNKELNKLMAIAAQCHQLLILITQHTRQIDVCLAMEPDIIIFKQPSLLHIRFARPELKPEVAEAYDRFSKARGNKKGWAFVMNYHNGQKGFLRTKLPSFWSEELSEVYARYELETLMGVEKTVKKKGERKNSGQNTSIRATTAD